MTVLIWIIVTVPGLAIAEPVKIQEPEISIALTGDSIITRPLSTQRKPALLKLVRLIRSTDAAFTNLETSLHDYEIFPMAEAGGIHLRAPPAMAKELVWAGFKLASFANNHTADWGVEGMRLTLKYAAASGLVVAGAGETLKEARQAKFLQTKKARIAMVACAATFTNSSPANNAFDGIPARPGLSPLRFTTTYVLAPDGMNALNHVADELGRKLPKSKRFRFLGNYYERGSVAAVRTEPNKTDMNQIAAAVTKARKHADLVIVSLHAHTSGAGRYAPADFIMTFSHAMIDSGADVVVGHGPHILRGIEIYKGKPIFYSLGNFIFENETVERLPLDDYEKYGVDPASGVAALFKARYYDDEKGFPSRREVWESVVAIPHWRNRKLQSVRLYPISLGFAKPAGVRGQPELASGELSRKIILDLKNLSKPFGTQIDYQDDVGMVKIK